MGHILKLRCLVMKSNLKSECYALLFVTGDSRGGEEDIRA